MTPTDREQTTKETTRREHSADDAAGSTGESQRPDQLKRAEELADQDGEQKPEADEAGGRK